MQAVPEQLLERVRGELETIPAIDHHAHLLRREEGPFSLGDDAAPLSEFVLESNDPVAAVRHVRHHPSYGRAMGDLGRLLGAPPDESAIAHAREAEGYAAYTRRLMAAAGLGAMFIDDGIRGLDLLTPPEQAALVGIPWRRVLRIETVVQDAADGWPSFDGVQASFGSAVSAALEDGLVALKTIAAFRCGLDLPAPNKEEAAAGYERWRRTGSARLMDPAVISFFVFEALRLTEQRRLPLQVHTGLVGTDIDLRAGDPAPLRTLLALPAMNEVPVVLLHCYPFIREASWLAGLFSNVYLDLCMVLQWVVHRGPDLIREALDVAPVSKLLFATDGFRVPELFYLGAKWWRDDLAHVLAGFIDRGFVDEVRAVEWGGFVLRANALRIYPFAEEQRT
jgi:uncharacterized protein